MKAMLLAAGLGTRMRPLTAATAKTLLPLGGRALIDHALDQRRQAGFEEVMVNVHWQSDRVADHLARRANGPRTVVLREAALLGTGGPVRSVLDRLGPAPFFIVNGDAFWLDGPSPALQRLRATLDPASMDGVLLAVRGFQVEPAIGAGDFAIDPLGRPREREIVPYVQAGTMLATPALFAGAPAGAFGLDALWDRAIAADRLRAVVHDGLWFDLATPSDLANAEYNLQARPLGEGR